ncbi:hypothetical protein [Methanofollis ethanolicus]|uniref:hypothetical protein n=1 Tax=Methanofollis ethanolicus TaxID=488124 RepID=UPI00082AC503|nr:hypothetical protein [Methanofollis ethanolicus]
MMASMFDGVVIGGGVYGVACARYLLDRGLQCAVVDPDPTCLAAESLRSCECVLVLGGIAVALGVILAERPAYVFPTAPLHVAAALVQAHSLRVPDIDGTDHLSCRIPLGILVSAGEGSLVVSYNPSGRCLSACAAPQVCPATGITRPVPLFALLRQAFPAAWILESLQLAPGIGALSGPDVIAVLEASEMGDPMIVGTACRCHGIVTALAAEKKGGSQSIREIVQK